MQPRPGTRIEPVHKRPDEIQLFLYCGATWNAHRIHYDRDHARAEGHEDLVVHGPLQGNWLVELVTAWAGPAARVRRVRFRNVATAYVNRDYEVGGRVAAVAGLADGTVEIECVAWVRGDAGVTTEGTVTVSRPADPS
jgi:hydroxyacyl-ACP dehydratase HTD2-like protein with hotdog domain